MNTLQQLTFVEPKTVIRTLAVKAGDTVADFGAGSGYFSFEFANVVGPEGKVYALDVLPSALEAITGKIKTLGLSNVTPQRCNLERMNGSGLESQSIDWVIAKDVLLQNKDKGIVLREIVRILKPSGKALIIEWDPSEAIVGPDKELRIQPAVLAQEIENAGLSIESKPAVGGFHYAFVVKKAKVL